MHTICLGFEDMIRQRIKNYENEHKTSTSKD